MKPVVTPVSLVEIAFEYEALADARLAIYATQADAEGLPAVPAMMRDLGEEDRNHAVGCVAFAEPQTTRENLIEVISYKRKMATTYRRLACKGSPAAVWFMTLAEAEEAHSVRLELALLSLVP